MTQNEVLLRAFNRGERLTVATALEKYGVYALSQRCGEIAKKNVICSQWLDLPNGKRIKEYWKPGQLDLPLEAA